MHGKTIALVMKHYEQEEKSDIVVNEELMYEALVDPEEIVMDGELDIDTYYERHKEAIEAANERIHKDTTRAPEGYYTLAEFDELFKKKLAEAYATL